jgi:hypothetical protein
MANVRKENVLRIDTSAQIDENLNIKSIKYIGNTSGTATIQDSNSSGTVIWQESGANNVYNPNVDIRVRTGCYVAVTNSAVVLLYL